MTATNTAKAILEGASVASEVFMLRPDYHALLVIVEGITTGPSDDLSERLLEEAEAFVRTQTAQQKSAVELPHIVAWQEAYKAFGSKPKKFRNSLEALTRRAEAGLPRINRLTDIYNAISVKHQIPLGGEDLEKYDGPPKLIRATGSEPFETIANGQTVVEHPDVGEVVWCDNAGVTCRRWNWRQGTRTALTDGTTNAIFILDALKPAGREALYSAADELVSALQQFSPAIQVARVMIHAEGRSYD